MESENTRIEYIANIFLSIRGRVENSTRHRIGKNKLLCPFISWNDRNREWFWATRSKISISQLSISVNVPYEKACICVIGRQVLCITCSLNVENREQRRDNNKQRRIDEVSPGANAFSESKCRSQNGIVTEASV